MMNTASNRASDDSVVQAMTAGRSLNTMADGRGEGCRVDERCMGTYIHGILDNPGFIDQLLAPWQQKADESAETFDYQAFKEEQYNRLADHVRKHVDMDRLYQIMTDGEEERP